MRSELHRNEVTDPQTIHDNLRDAAYHEAGHVVVAHFLGLTIREVEIAEDGSGRADIGPAEHLPLVDQIVVCVAGIEAQELFNCPMHDHAALGDYRKVRGLLAGLTETESHEYLHAGYLRALEILKGQLPEIEKLADQLLNHGASRPNMPDILMGFLIGCALGLGVGYAVRERVSRQRRRRHRERSIY